MQIKPANTKRKTPPYPAVDDQTLFSPDVSSTRPPKTQPNSVHQLDDYPIQYFPKDGLIQFMDVNANGKIFAGHYFTEAQIHLMRTGTDASQRVTAPPRIMRPNIVRLGAQSIRSMTRQQLLRGIKQPDPATERRLSLIDCTEPSSPLFAYARSAVTPTAQNIAQHNDHTIMQQQPTVSCPATLQFSATSHQRRWDSNGRRIVQSIKQRQLEDQLFKRTNKSSLTDTCRTLDKVPCNTLPSSTLCHVSNRRPERSEKMIRAIRYEQNAARERKRPTARRVKGIPVKLSRPQTATSIITIVDSNVSLVKITTSIDEIVQNFAGDYDKDSTLVSSASCTSIMNAEATESSTSATTQSAVSAILPVNHAKRIADNVSSHRKKAVRRSLYGKSSWSCDKNGDIL